MLKEGSVAPAIELLDQNGKMLSLKKYAKRKVLVYFYPKAGTPGCTKEACAFRDDLKTFADGGYAGRLVEWARDKTHVSLEIVRRMPWMKGFWESGFIKALEGGSVGVLNVAMTCASAGIIVGVVTLTGAGFRISFMVTQAAAQTAEFFRPIVEMLPSSMASMQGLTLFLTLFFVALVCIAMGCGIPTTALYIVLAAIAAPAVQQLGVPPLAAHLFILYYGILADLTPPVCVAAYAAAGIAGSNPFRTGLTAFRLGLAKATVPFVFAYSPAMLIMVDGFTWGDFLFTTISCAIGVLVLGIGVYNAFVKKIFKTAFFKPVKIPTRQVAPKSVDGNLEN